MKLTEYEKLCVICNQPKSDTHHLCFNYANRKLSTEDELIAPVCRDCHDFIHKNGKAAKMSKIIGQLQFEKNRILEGRSAEDAREDFRKRYGVSYL